MRVSPKPISVKPTPFRLWGVGWFVCAISMSSDRAVRGGIGIVWPVGGEGRRVERDGDRLAAVERDLHLIDRTIDGTGAALREGDVVDGLLPIGVDGQVLADHVAVDEPRGARVAVDRLGRAVARRDVAAAVDGAALLLDDGATAVAGLRERVEVVLGARRILTGPLGVAAVVADAPEELLVATPVGVGEHQVGVRRGAAVAASSG